MDHLSHFSSWTRGIGVTACLLRRARKDKSTSLTTVMEREIAVLVIVKDLQRQVYQDSVKILSKGEQLPVCNPLYHLDPFVDKYGVLRVGGRLLYSYLILLSFLLSFLKAITLPIS